MKMGTVHVQNQAPDASTARSGSCAHSSCRAGLSVALHGSCPPRPFIVKRKINWTYIYLVTTMVNAWDFLPTSLHGCF